LDCAVRLGVDDAPEKRHQAIRWAYHYWAQSTHLMEDLRLYNEHDEQFWNNYSKKYLIAFGCHPELAEVIALEANRIMMSEYHPKDCIADDVFQTLNYLKTQQFQLAIVTNRREPCQDYLKTMGLFPYFEFSLVAGEINMWKPNAGIFSHALERLQISPQEAIFIGDNYYTDVVGAQQVGMLPVLIDPEGIFPNVECPVISRLGEFLALF
jgi:HAD superfamily hydrolase (TIGR01549 family)